ncbi:hypothetical protein MSMEG_1785 [Mycolicibacterium smegmatis MC2 155]|uniref:Uncharacterized protein n=1 Tax=Mycolicibacterium smegmatis (strain ATCC 700084 / mc(2)155) TaxID=246196 RepID=A0QTB8_MYCS2|nr:hypothetical protein MSMEG_1785 [Mycolicibacterium smegmatis MC2 155]
MATTLASPSTAGGFPDQPGRCPVQHALALASPRDTLGPAHRGLDRDAVAVGLHHPWVDVGAARDRRGVPQPLGDLPHHRRLDALDHFGIHRRIGVDERLGGQHRTVPGAQVLDRVVLADHLFEAKIEVVGMDLHPIGRILVGEKTFPALAVSLQCPHGTDHVVVLDEQRTPHPALSRIVELHCAAAHAHVFALQCRDTERVVLLGVFLASRAEVPEVEQAQPQCQHPVASQAPPREVDCHMLPPIVKPCRHFQYTVELLLAALLLPLRVVQVLAPAGDIGADSLDVAGGMGADPHRLPRRWDDEIVDALQHLAISYRLSVGLFIAEAAAPADPLDPRAVDDASTQAHDQQLATRLVSARARVTHSSDAGGPSGRRR